MARHVVVLGPVDHDGTRYQDGDEVTLPPEAAAVLVALGVVELAVAVQKGKSDPKD
jgi:hypothetical protein